jgi:DNA-directed RNA polymerase subunit E'/Rpb7
MDPLFERRELVRNVHLDAKFLQRNIQASLLAQLRMKFEGVCVAEGYIQRQSITIVEHSMGRMNMIKGGLDYAVRFQGDICMPHPGQTFRAPVVLKSKIGVHAETTPIKVLLPRDLHIGNASFEDVEEGQEIEFEVVGSRFQQGDDSIVVLAKLRNVIMPAAPGEVSATEAEESAVIDTSRPDATVGTSEERRVVTVDPQQAVSAAYEARRRQVRLNAKQNTNEPFA